MNFALIVFVDKDITTDEKVVELVEDMERRLKNGEKIFIHCRGGHGRTGTIIAILIGKLFELEAYDALEKTQQFHDHRADVKKKPGVYSCPETSTQTNQVYRILGKIN